APPPLHALCEVHKFAGRDLRRETTALVSAIGSHRAVRNACSGDGRVANELAPIHKARLDELAALLRVALVRERRGPREAFGQPAPDETVELRLGLFACRARALVRREREGDAGLAGCRCGEAGGVLPEPRDQRAFDVQTSD